MPAHQRLGLGLEDDRSIEGSGNWSVDPNENQPFRVPQSERFRRRSPQDEELLPEKENFHVTRGAGPACPRRQPAEEREKRDNSCGSLPDEWSSAILDGIFNSDTV